MMKYKFEVGQTYESIKKDEYRVITRYPHMVTVIKTDSDSEPETYKIKRGRAFDGLQEFIIVYDEHYEKDYIFASCKVEKHKDTLQGHRTTVPRLNFRSMI